MIIENKSETERMLESLGIKVRNENGDICSKEELTTEVMALLESCDKEDGIRLLFAFSAAAHVDRPFGQ